MGYGEMIDLHKVEVYLKSNRKWFWINRPRPEDIEALKATLSTQEPLKVLELPEIGGLCTEERAEVSNWGWFEKSRKLEGLTNLRHGRDEFKYLNLMTN